MGADKQAFNVVLWIIKQRQVRNERTEIRVREFTKG